MFASALGAVTGVDNRLALKRVESSLVIVVDGLGYNNLKSAAGHARFLNRQVSNTTKTFCGFPSTTASSLTSFGTGMKAGEHGIVGYQVFDMATRKPVNQLSGWSGLNDPLEWQPNPTIAQSALATGVTSYFVGPKEYSDSGFTQLTMRGAKYLPADTIEDRLKSALELLSTSESKLVYLYVPELDQRAHTFGVDSFEWRSALEHLDAALENFAQQLEKKEFAKVGVIITADHGIIDVPSDKHFYLDELEIPGLLWVAGEPRVNFIYLEKSLPSAELDLVAGHLNGAVQRSANGSGIYFATKAEIIAAGIYGKVVSKSAEVRMPDFFALAVSRRAVYHREFATPRSQLMIGQHGGLDPDEISIPLIALGAFAQ